MKKLSILSREISSVHAAALLLGAAGLLSRILGVLRDRLLAGHFGAGRELDIYYAAFQIPDTLSTLFLLGAGSGVILPVFQRYLMRDRVRAYALIAHLFRLFLVAAVFLGAGAFFAAPALMRVVAPGFSGSDRVMSVELARIMLISPILFGLSWILSSVVESFQRFWAYAIAPILYNAGIIMGIIFLVPVMGLWGLGAGVACGALLHLLTQLVAIRDLGLRLLPRISRARKDAAASGGRALADPGVREILKISFPRMLSVSLSRITVIILTALGSTLAAGSIAVFSLAHNLYFVPIGIFAISYVVALFPRMSRAAISRDGQAFLGELFFGIRAIVFWIAPSSALLLVLRAHVVRVALGAGAFSWEDTRLTAATLAAFVLALWAGSIISLLIKGFYALNRTREPLLVNLAGSVLSVGLAIGAVRLLAGHAPGWTLLADLFRIGDLRHQEVLGLALGFSGGLILNVVMLYYALIRLVKKIIPPPAPMRFPLAPVGKIILASCGAGAAAYLVRISFAHTLPLVTFFHVLLELALAGTMGALGYAGLLWLLGSEDMRWFMDGMRNKLLRFRVVARSWNGEMQEHPDH